MTGCRDERPIAQDELAGLFRRIEGRAAVLAVSGGPDSTALMVLVARWLFLRRSMAGGDDSAIRERVLVVTVDHCLRPQSGDEARTVARTAAELGLVHRTLVWSEPKPAAGLMEAARLARYRLLREAACDLAPPGGALIVTAHHRDDLVETFLMRLARGSGIDGLVGMLSEDVGAFAPPVPLVHRPFLDVPKSRLVSTLRAAGATWIDDPSNDSQVFERTRLRRAIPALADIGLTSEAISLSIGRLARTLQVVQSQAIAAYERTVSHNDGTWATIDTRDLLALPEDTGVRVLRRCLGLFGGRGQPPPLSDTERLLERIRSRKAAGRIDSQTLAGCLLEPSGDGTLLHVLREAGRDGLPQIRCEPDADGKMQAVQWDRRFLVEFGTAAGTGPFLVRALGEDGLAVLVADGLDVAGRPRRALLTAPSAWLNGSLVAIPPFSGLPERSVHPAACSLAIRLTPLAMPVDPPSRFRKA